MTLNPRLGRFQKSPSFQSAVNHPLARTPVSTTTRASTSEPGTAARVEPRRAFHRKAPLARVPAAARPAPLPPRSPARPRSQARLGLRALLGLTRGAPGMTPGTPQGLGLCRLRNARRGAGEGKAGAGCQESPDWGLSPPQPVGSGLPTRKVRFGPVGARKVAAQPLGRSRARIAASKLPFLD